MALDYRLGLLLGFVTSACFAPGEGVEPPLNRVYFPVGLALDADARHLFVVNSNFDLQFNGGTVQSFDLVGLRAAIPENAPDDCGGLGRRRPEDQVIVPGACGSLDPENPPGGGPSLITSAVGIGAFATDVTFRARPSEDEDVSGRLYVPVRGDTTLHFINVDASGNLECGQASNEGDCSDGFRRGDDPEQENTRGIRLPPEPFGVAAQAPQGPASPDGSAIAVTHQTEGAASLFVERPGQSGPQLEFVAGGMPARPIGIVSVPEPAIVKASEPPLDYQPGFLVTFRDASEVRLLRFFDDAASVLQRPFLDVTSRAEIRTNSTGFDSRGIAIDPSRRRAAEEACEALADQTQKLECLRTAAAVPLGVYVANRTPASLVVGETSPSSSNDLPHFFDSLPLDFGPSRVVVGKVITREGNRETRVFVVCFDARAIYVYDPASRRIETRIDTGRGPHALVLDVADDHALAYVGHFTDSYIAVIELDQRNPSTYGKTVLTVGKPTPPRASK